MNKSIDITEEALDDWIAQSTNRPLVSFLDPYKKFKAPNKLIQLLKKRYNHKLVQAGKDEHLEKKMLYFDERREQMRVPNYMKPIRQGKETMKEVAFNFTKLGIY